MFLSSERRRSPSVYKPSTLFCASTIAVMPRPFLLISSRASEMLAFSATFGMRSPVCMISDTCSNKRLPRLPPGWDRAKSSAVKPRACSRLTAIASPITKATVVLDVGAKSCGQASLLTLTSRLTSAATASAELASPVMLISGTPKRFKMGMMVAISAVLPELDKAMTTSFGVIMPRSPWLASPGWTKNAGLPVLARVAAILLPI